jgi:predicted CDP-diglyceride synthetase/phosphatidate cytidylyltransferase
MNGPENRFDVVLTKPTKAIVGAIGGIIQAAAVLWTAVSFATADDAVDFNEIGGLVVAVLTFAGTVVAIYKTTNKPVN